MASARGGPLHLLVPPPIVVLAAALAMWGIDALVPQARIAVPFQVPVGAGLIAIGLAFDLVSVAAFLRARTTVTPLAPDKTARIVTGGLYRISRNPMYLGMLLVLIGIAILLRNPLGLIAAAVFVAYITAFQITPEERLLEAKFGEDYLRYKRSVRRWL